MPLPDLLQWADTTRAAGQLEVERNGATVWMYFSDREVVRVSERPEAHGALEMLAPESAHRPWLKLADEVEAVERLLDLFLEADGTFLFDDAATPNGGVCVSVSLRELVYEGMRHLDEWPALDQRYPDERARLIATGQDRNTHLLPAARTVLRAAAQGLTLGEIRLALGLSRPALLRRTQELVSLGLARVEGVERDGDPVEQILAQAEILSREEQYDEAAHVVGALLESDPGDRRVRDALARIESRQRAHLYEHLGPERIPVLTGEPVAVASREEAVLPLVDGQRDVASIVLASPIRELETLRALRDLSKRRVLDFQASHGDTATET